MKIKCVYNKFSVKARGQAMTEYALMAMAIMAGSVFLFQSFMTAYQYYTRAFYLLLILQIP